VHQEKKLSFNNGPITFIVIIFLFLSTGCTQTAPTSTPSTSSPEIIQNVTSEQQIACARVNELPDDMSYSLRAAGESLVDNPKLIQPFLGLMQASFDARFSDEENRDFQELAGNFTDVYSELNWVKLRIEDEFTNEVTKEERIEVHLDKADRSIQKMKDFCKDFGK